MLSYVLGTYHTYSILHRYYYFNHISPLHKYYYIWHQLCLLHVPLIHEYTISLDIVNSYNCINVTWVLCTQLYHVHTLLLHIFTGIYALIVSIFLSHRSPFILHRLLLHVYSCIPATWLFSVTYIDIPVTGHECCWYAMCRTKCHVDLSHGGHL